MAYSNAGNPLPKIPTTMKYGRSLRWSFFISRRKNGKNAKPAIPILQPKTCKGEKAIRLFLMRIKELPHIKLSITSKIILNTVGDTKGALSTTLLVNVLILILKNPKVKLIRY